MSDKFDIEEYKNLANGAVDFSAGDTTLIPVIGDEPVDKTTVMPPFDLEKTTIVPVLGSKGAGDGSTSSDNSYSLHSSAVIPRMAKKSSDTGDTVLVEGTSPVSDKTTVIPISGSKKHSRSAAEAPTGRHTAVHSTVSKKLKPSYSAAIAKIANAPVGAKRKTDAEDTQFAKQGLPPEKQGKKRLSKGWIYVICVSVALLALVITALVLRGDFDTKRYDSIVSTAQERFDSGDYSGCLAYLRKAQDIQASDELWLMMADCYSKEQNYEKALECLRSVSKITPEITEKINETDAARKALSAPETVTVAGQSYPVSSSSINLDGQGLGDAELQQLSAVYSLTELSLANNAIYDISPLTALGGLTTLNLSGNRISDISPLTALGSLRVLYLDTNPISDISPLYSLTNLTLLSARGLGLTPEQISELSAALPNCAIHTDADSPQVHEISLGGSSFSSDCSSVTLSGCGITDISALSGCKNLKSVDLSGNEISDISPLMDIPGLETLVLSNNNISNIYPLMGITGLKVLYLDGNAVSTVSSLGSLRALEELYLAGNPLTSCQGLGVLTQLNTLDLTNTGLTNELLLQLNSCFSLKRLTIKDNPLLTADAVDTLGSTLKGANISCDKLPYPIQVGTVTVLDNVTELQLPDLGITDIAILAKFPSATKVNLSGNSLSNLYSLDYLKDPWRITELDLSNNNLSELNGLAKLQNLEQLNLSGNPVNSTGQLVQLTKLKDLYLIGTQLNPTQLLELCNALPNCNVHYE